ncbi:MAG: response regulator transcription factor [Candidatus Obscuribacterales bacterium]|nr:response regulator transcription factor [Candidatus Obscuribacterales bacterium]
MKDHQKRIVVCDESELVYAGLKFVVEQNADLLVIDHAQSEHELLRLAAEHKPDLYVLDLSSRKINILHLAQRLKSEHPMSKILFLTDLQDSEKIQQALLLGADGICLKNANRNLLLAAIHSVSLGAIWLAPETSRILASVVSRPAFSITTLNDFQLSKRELEVLELMVSGLSNAELAAKLYVSPETIKSHLRRIYEKLAVRHRTEAVTKAIKSGLIRAA